MKNCNLNVKAFAITCGVLWALVDGLIVGAIFASVYNLLASRRARPVETT